MHASEHIHPTTLPPGYDFVIEDEPVFDPTIHLQLERPAHIWTLSDFGYDAHAISRFASPIAATSPARILSDAGIEALVNITHKLRPFIRHNTHATRVPATLRGTTHRSRFIRDLCLSPEVTEFFGEMFQTGLMPHTITHQQGHMNFQPRELSREVDSWHHDSTAFDWVLMVHDPNSLRGGRFEFFRGTREEGAALLRKDGALPDDRIITPDFPGPGYACYMQGAAVYHRATRLEELGFRSSLVQSYVSYNVSVPDANRFDWIEPSEQALMDPNFMLERQCEAAEWGRHRAWVARERLGHLIEDIPMNASAETVAQALEHVTDDLNHLIGLLRRGAVSREEAQRLRDALDAAQMA